MTTLNTPIEQILATLATKEALKALEARLEAIEARFGPVMSDEEQRASDERFAKSQAALKELIERLSRPTVYEP